MEEKEREIVKKEKKWKKIPPVLPEEDEETDEQMDRKREPFLNEAGSVFDKNVFGGINTEKSVFDSTAVFHTKP